MEKTAHPHNMRNPRSAHDMRDFEIAFFIHTIIFEGKQVEEAHFAQRRKIGRSPKQRVVHPDDPQCQAKDIRQHRRRQLVEKQEQKKTRYFAKRIQKAWIHQ